MVGVVVVDGDGAESPRSGAGRLTGKVAASLLGPHCFVGEDGSAPFVVPWEQGFVCR